MAGEENMDSCEDLRKYLKRSPAKARTPRIEIREQQSPGVSSSSSGECMQPDENEDRGPVDSGIVLGFADHSGNLKPKSEEKESKIQRRTRDIDHQDMATRTTPSCSTDAISPKTPPKRYASTNPEPIADDGRHTCKICFKKFSSGQALGGHQRHHRTVINMPRGRKTPEILDFDLNELPKKED